MSFLANPKQIESQNVASYFQHGYRHIPFKESYGVGVTNLATSPLVLTYFINQDTAGPKDIGWHVSTHTQELANKASMWSLYSTVSKHSHC